MTRAVLLGGLPVLVALAFACGDRVIIIHDPAHTGKTTGSSGEIASGGNPEGDPEAPWGINERTDPVEYSHVVDRVVGMVNDQDLLSRVRRRGLNVVNVAWEDTGRNEGSSVGPNISDLSLQVRERTAGRNVMSRTGYAPQYRSSVMPVIRLPNFSDKTGDVAADKFFIRVGNESSSALRTVPLTDVLRDIRSFASVPSSIIGDGNLLASRDSHFLVSSQAVFLPIPKTGKAEFNPVIFNYQSSPGQPAVLSILVTRQGTSVSVIENRPQDTTAAGWGQELYFNAHGQRAAFTAERKTDVANRIAAQGGPKNEDDRSALAKGADVLFLIQVPLVHATRHRGYYAPKPPSFGEFDDGEAKPKKSADNLSPPSAAPSGMGGARRQEKSDVEQAVLGHGPNVGPFSEGHGLRLVRDTRFPVRITVQFYKATSNGVVSDIDLDSIARSLGSVYEHADYVGSLVLPEGDSRRPTAWQRMPKEWFPW